VNNLPVILVRHRKPEIIVRSFFNVRAHNSSLTMQYDGRRVVCRGPSALLRYIKRKGAWSFCSLNRSVNTIHLWTSRGRAATDAMLVAHEVAHVVGFKERDAARVGAVAGFAVYLLQKGCDE
jgi:hypothetical protein